MNGCNVSFAVSQIEDCLELNFRYVDYQTLAHLSCSSCVYWIPVRATRVQCFISVQESISASMCHGPAAQKNLSDKITKMLGTLACSAEYMGFRHLDCLETRIATPQLHVLFIIILLCFVYIGW